MESVVSKYDPVHKNLFEVSFSNNTEFNLLNANLISIQNNGSSLSLKFNLNIVAKTIQPLSVLESCRHHAQSMEVVLNVLNKKGEVVRTGVYKNCTVDYINALDTFDYTSKDLHELNVDLKYTK